MMFRNLQISGIWGYFLSVDRLLKVFFDTKKDTLLKLVQWKQIKVIYLHVYFHVLFYDLKSWV